MFEKILEPIGVNADKKKADKKKADKKKVSDETISVDKETAKIEDKEVNRKYVNEETRKAVTRIMNRKPPRPVKGHTIARKGNSRINKQK